jgi:hypothetical protein
MECKVSSMRWVDDKNPNKYACEGLIFCFLRLGYP